MIAALFCFLLGVTLLVEPACGDGTLEIRILGFHNEPGTHEGGRCCDSSETVCSRTCDYIFKMCLDNNLNSYDMTRCAYALLEHTAAVAPNFNTIHFLGAVNFNFRFSGSTPTSARLKVDVWDEDVGPDDHVVLLATNLDMRGGDPSREIVLTQGHYSIRLRVIMQCNPHTYGSMCNVYCEESDDESGHYTCDQQYGHKICLPGWTGPICTTEPEPGK